METDKTKISGARLMFTIAFFLQSSALLTSFIASVTFHDSWIVIIISSILSLPLILLYKTIMVRFPKNNLIEILRIVFGKVIGNIIALMYIWFFFVLTALNVGDLGAFAKLAIMFNTPKIVLLFLCMFVAIFAVRYGLGVVTRYSAIFVVLEFVIVGVSTLLIINQIDLSFFEPMLTLDLERYIQSTHIAMTVPIGETVIFLMLTPNIRIEKKKITKYWIVGAIMGIGTLFVVLVRDIGVLGNTIHMFQLPGLITLRLINVGSALSRMEILFAAALMFLLFFKVSLLLYVSVKSVSSFFKISSYKNLVLVIGVLICFLAMSLFTNPVEHVEYSKKYAPFIWTFFEIIIPILLFVVAFIRKLPQKQKQKESVLKNKKEVFSMIKIKKLKPKANKKKNREVSI